MQAEKIREYLVGKVRNKLQIYNPETNSMPFHFRLLGRDRMALFSFIQSVNTMLGTSIFEQIGQMIAEPKAEKAVGQYKGLVGHIGSDAVLAIDNIVRDLRSVSRKPDKKLETKEILKVAGSGNLGKLLKKRVDLFLETNDGVEYYFELKTAKPNISEFASVKRQLLEIIAMRGSQNPKAKAKSIVAIPYNPYEPEPYDRWTLSGLLDLREELLVGKEFWDFLGGDGTYENLLDIFEQAGLELYDDIERKMKNLRNKNKN